MLSLQNIPLSCNITMLHFFRCMGVSGTVKINQRLRDMAIFRKMSCYVMQEDLLQPNLTLFEAISVSASLKLGPSISSNDKKTIVSYQFLGNNKYKKYFDHFCFSCVLTSRWIISFTLYGLQVILIWLNYTVFVFIYCLFHIILNFVLLA